MSTTSSSASLGWQLNDTNVITLVFVFVFVVARVLTKVFLTHAPGWDDYISVLALCFAIARTINDGIGVKSFGIGRHFVTLSPSQLDGLVTSLAVDTALYFVAIALAKLAILIFLHRIFSVDNKFRWTSFALGALILLWATTSALINIFACKPFMARYKLSYQMAHPGFHCIDVSNAILYYGWFNTITDFIQLIMPMPMIWRMQMALSKKLGVAVVFASGALVCGISVYRLHVFYVNNQSPDVSWLVVKSKIWISLEVNFAIITGCLPTLQPLFRRMFRRYFPSSPRTSGTKPSFVIRQESDSWPKRDYSRGDLGIKITKESRRSTSDPEQGLPKIEPDPEPLASALYMYHREYLSRNFDVLT